MPLIKFSIVLGSSFGGGGIETGLTVTITSSGSLVVSSSLVTVS
jgi:hypothetical protein